MAKFMETIKEKWNKCVEWTKEKLSKVDWKMVWDKFTTGLLIFLMASPILILAYIFIWFMVK